MHRYISPLIILTHLSVNKIVEIIHFLSSRITHITCYIHIHECPQNVKFYREDALWSWKYHLNNKISCVITMQPHLIYSPTRRSPIWSHHPVKNWRSSGKYALAYGYAARKQPCQELALQKSRLPSFLGRSFKLNSYAKESKSLDPSK